MVLMCVASANMHVIGTYNKGFIAAVPGCGCLHQQCWMQMWWRFGQWLLEASCLCLNLLCLLDGSSGGMAVLGLGWLGCSVVGRLPWV